MGATIDMEKYIRESNLIEGIDDPVEDAQSLSAWTWLSQQDNIGCAELFELHKRIVKNQNDLSPNEKGNYRFMQVYVGGYQPPNALRVAELMEDWLHELAFYNDHDPKEQHIKFEKIHPFADGNGRTGRMLMWWHELKLGRLPTLLLAKERQEYYKWFTPTKRTEGK